MAGFKTPIISGLHEIQQRCGYLPKEEMKALAEKLSNRNGNERVPLAKVQAVASFYPHFHLQEPPAVQVKICRDMTCFMKHGGKRIDELVQLGNWPADQVKVCGVSCQGRCDRAPVTCVTTCNGKERDDYYLGKSAKELKQVVDALLEGKNPPIPPDRDIDNVWTGSTYQLSGASELSERFTSAKEVAAARWKAIDQAAQFFQKTSSLSDGLTEKFRESARQEHRKLRPVEPDPTKLGDMEEFLKSPDPGLDEVWRQWVGFKGPLTKPGGPPADAIRCAALWSEPYLAKLEAANLRGMGGAGFNTWQKWRDLRDALRDSDRVDGFVVCNGDESEPGTFKDRDILLRLPHLVVEGVIIAGILSGATHGIIFIRHEYHEEIQSIRAAVRLAEANGLCGENASALGRSFPVTVVASPGGYILGEQSALVEALNDNRGEPRNLPPPLESNGLYNCPTVVNNVETFAWVPYILQDEMGGARYARLGAGADEDVEIKKLRYRGKRFFSVSGDVKRPGIYEVPIGMTMGELIDEYCGGVVGGKLKAIAPSGPSGGFLPTTWDPTDKMKKKEPWDKFDCWAEYCAAEIQRLKDNNKEPVVPEKIDILKLPLDIEAFRKLGLTQMLGAGIVVYNDTRNIVEHIFNAISFFRNESCGKCVPCRIGSQKLADFGDRLLAGKIAAADWPQLDDSLNDLIELIGTTSICGLGRSLPPPITSLQSFKNDLKAFVK